MGVDDPRLSDAKAKPIKDVAHDLGLHWLQRGYPEVHGYCPQCGGAEKAGSDRFWIDLAKNSWGCRKCATGGDVVALVRFVQGCSFGAALEWLCGPKAARQETAAEREERLAKEKAAADETERQARRYRENAIAAARALWREGRPAAGTLVQDYLALRGIDVERLGGMPGCLRFHPALRFTEKIDGAWRTLHEGPAMIAAVQDATGRFCGLHRTWIDLSQPKGKAVVVHPVTGEVLSAKKLIGSKKGGAIRLTGRREAAVMVMAEGIESTFSCWRGAGPFSGAMFWVGVDLGNMGGRQQRGKGLRFAGLPDADLAAFVPPEAVRHLLFVMDGDSEPRATRATLEAGLRRAMLARLGLRGAIAAMPPGLDANDVLLGAATPGLTPDEVMQGGGCDE